MMNRMRVFAISDVHVDYPENLNWLLQLSDEAYKSDILILAGDVSASLELLATVLESLTAKFNKVLFVPGNHDLWDVNDEFDCALTKLSAIESLCNGLDVSTTVYRINNISFVPLLAWYDYSFATPDRHLRRAWRDYRACKWPEHLNDSGAITRHFLNRNETLLAEQHDIVISYSHFLPRIDVMPERIPQDRRRVYPVLGSNLLEQQVRQLNSKVHIYGHSHVNQSIELDGTLYINNAFAYPAEERIARKKLHCFGQIQSGAVSSRFEVVDAVA